MYGAGKILIGSNRTHFIIVKSFQIEKFLKLFVRHLHVGQVKRVFKQGNDVLFVYYRVFTPNAADNKRQFVMTLCISCKIFHNIGELSVYRVKIRWYCITVPVSAYAESVYCAILLLCYFCITIVMKPIWKALIYEYRMQSFWRGYITCLFGLFDVLFFTVIGSE